MIVCTGDHEYQIFDSIADHDDYGPSDDCELFAADLVVKLDGWRGHYLGRDFIYEAIELVDKDTVSIDRIADNVAILDRYEDEPTAEIEPSFTVAECVSEMVGEYEGYLADAGYLVEWNDGFRIVKVGEEINKEMAR